MKLIGAGQVMGAVGLVLPWATGILPVLTPVAAACLTALMGGAVLTHVKRKELPFPAAILCALALFLALGRFGVL